MSILFLGLFLFFALLVFSLPIFFLLFMAISFIYRQNRESIYRQNREGKKAVWRQLAATHHLNFVPDNSLFGKGAYVDGIYRNHSIILETVKQTCTRIGVFAYSQQTDWQQDQKQHDPPLSTTEPPRDPSGYTKTPPGYETLSFQEAINRFTSLFSSYEIRAEPNGRPIYYEQYGVIENIQSLEHFLNFLTDLAKAYSVVMAEGGEAIPILQSDLENIHAKQIILRLIGDIALETSKRLAHRAHRLLCPRCLTRFGPHKVDLLMQIDPTYYGCRMCSQSRKFYEGLVVAVLDNQGTDTPVQQNNVVRVNWSTHRKLFDFDSVEIIQATDEEAERFAVQVGNDTDETRKARYQEMQCVVHPNCQLSENTLRILRQTFSQVVSGEENKLKDKSINRLSEDEKISEQESN